MRRKIFMVLGVMLMIASFSILNQCKFGHPDYTLTITIGEGISGTPEAGTYVYKEFTEIEFEYFQEEGKVYPELYVNGNRKEGTAGLIVMYSNIDLEVKQIDIRGEWTLTLMENSVVKETWNITFGGTTITAGTFSDDKGRHGTWQAAGNTVEFTYANWNQFKFTGTLNEMAGNWVDGPESGNWVATRQQ